jgi:hypothetical protein
MQSTKEFWSRRQPTDSSNIEDWLLTRQFSSYSSRRRRRARSEGRPHPLLAQEERPEDEPVSFPSRPPPAVQYLLGGGGGRTVSEFLDDGGGSGSGRPSSQYLAESGAQATALHYQDRSSGVRPMSQHLNSGQRPSSVYVNSGGHFSPTTASSPFPAREIRREGSGSRPASLFIQTEDGRSNGGGRRSKSRPLSSERTIGGQEIVGLPVTSPLPRKTDSGGGNTAASSPSEDSGNSSLNTSTTDSRRSAAGQLQQRRRSGQQQGLATGPEVVVGHHGRKAQPALAASPTTREYREAAASFAEAREAKQAKRRSHQYPDMARANYMENRWSAIYSDTELYSRVGRRNKD